MKVSLAPANNDAPDLDIGQLVEPERVHRRLYTDAELFELEMDRLFGRTWLYVGHESQVPRVGDYFTSKIGRQPVVMTRHKDGQIYVLENRCPHKGALVCPERSGHAPRLVCKYHGWSFDGDGSLRSLPLRAGYDGTCFDADDPANGMKRLPRVENHRGFVFASLSEDVPDFKTWAGEGLRGFDNVVDRAPDGEIEVVGNCYRTVLKGNWKTFLENMFDPVHTYFVHWEMTQSAVRTLETYHDQCDPAGLPAATRLSVDPAQLAHLEVWAHPNGHGDFGAFLPEVEGEDADEYKAALIARHGKERTNEILGRSYHNAALFPGALMQASIQQLRIIKPIAVDETMMEIWIFRLKGAPESFWRRAVTTANLANSPSNIVAADDYETYYRVQAGLEGPRSDWVLLHRDANTDVPVGSSLRGQNGNSEVGIRNLYKAWREYMTDGPID